MGELYDEEYLKASELYKKQIGAVGDAYNAWKTQAMNAGAIDKKTKELMALAAACAIQCEYCIDSHAQKAKAYGATPQEIAETIAVAGVVKVGATISYGINALKHFE